MIILWPFWNWPRFRRKRRDPTFAPAPQFAIVRDSGNDFLAEGAVHSLRFTAVHRLSCTKIGKPAPDSTFVQAYRGDRDFIKPLLEAERRQKDKAIWSEILRGQPTHQLNWGYTLRSSGEYRTLVNYAFNFDLGVYPPAWEISKAVCEFIVFQAHESEKERWGLLRSDPSIEFWHLAIARVVINLF